MLESIIQFFETIPTSTRTTILISGLAGFWLLESVVPLFRFEYAKVKHAGLNLFFTLTTLIINLGLAFLMVKASFFVSENQFGIFYLLDIPLWAHVIMGVLLLDFIGAYFIHWLEHHVKWMWKFHVIHHTDTTVDVTTGLRHHPGESVFRAIFTTLAILVAGVPFGIVMLYQTMSAIFAQLTHANIKMPAFIEKYLSLIFVTPHFHKIHHHNVQPLTDSNYGNIFSIWDHLFNTVAVGSTVSKLVYGIDTHMQSEEHSSLKNLLAIPFQEYRAPIGSKFSDE